MQQALNREGYSLDVDGGFGKKTLAALMDYQRRVGMTPDGVAGSKTWASLGVQSAQDRLADLVHWKRNPTTCRLCLGGTFLSVKRLNYRQR